MLSGANKSSEDFESSRLVAAVSTARSTFLFVGFLALVGAVCFWIYQSTHPDLSKVAVSLKFLPYDDTIRGEIYNGLGKPLSYLDIQIRLADNVENEPGSKGKFKTRLLTMDPEPTAFSRIIRISRPLPAFAVTQFSTKVGSGVTKTEGATTEVKVGEHAIQLKGGHYSLRLQNFSVIMAEFE